MPYTAKVTTQDQYTRSTIKESPIRVKRQRYIRRGSHVASKLEAKYVETYENVDPRSNNIEVDWQQNGTILVITTLEAFTSCFLGIT